MNVRCARCWLIVAAIAVLCGCAPNSPEPAASAVTPVFSSTPKHFAFLLSAHGSYFIAYATHPDPIPLNEPFSIQVKVYDGASRSQLLSDVKLDVDGRMPHHRHGMNRQPQVTSHGDGTFTIAGMLFHMPGRWELYFDINRAGQTERAQAVVVLD